MGGQKGGWEEPREGGRKRGWGDAREEGQKARWLCWEEGRTRGRTEGQLRGRTSMHGEGREALGEPGRVGGWTAGRLRGGRMKERKAASRPPGGRTDGRTEGRTRRLLSCPSRRTAAPTTSASTTSGSPSTSLGRSPRCPCQESPGMLGSAPPCPTLLCVPPPRLETVVVGVTDVVDVTVTLRNRGEDSYGTTVQLHHAAALSYRKAVVLQVTPPEPSSAWKTPQKSPRPSRSAFGLLKLFPTRSRLPTRPRGRPTPLGTSLRFPTSPRGLPTPLQTSSRPPEVYLASPTPPQPSSRSSVGSRGLRNLLRVLSIPKPRNETSHIPACPPQALQRCRWPPKPFRMSSKAPRSPSGLPTSPDPPPRVVSPPPPTPPRGDVLSPPGDPGPCAATRSRRRGRGAEPSASSTTPSSAPAPR